MQSGIPTTSTQADSTHHKAKSGISVMQIAAWVYAGLFLFVVALGYIPGLTNAHGQLMGLFHIDPIDDILHFGSGLWAAIAAWRSTYASTLYFKIFGVLYGLDGIIG